MTRSESTALLATGALFVGAYFLTRKGAAQLAAGETTLDAVRTDDGSWIVPFPGSSSTPASSNSSSDLLEQPLTLSAPSSGVHLL